MSGDSETQLHELASLCLGRLPGRFCHGRLGRIVDGGGFSSVYRLEGVPGCGHFVVKVTATWMKGYAQVADEKAAAAVLVCSELEIMEQLTEAQSPEQPMFVPLESGGVFTWDDDSCLVLLVMPELLQFGRVLADRKFSEQQLCRIAQDLCRALLFLHRRGIYHRDIKTANVMYSAGRVLIGDFGSAVLLDSRLDWLERQHCCRRTFTRFDANDRLLPNQVTDLHCLCRTFCIFLSGSALPQRTAFRSSRLYSVLFRGWGTADNQCTVEQMLQWLEEIEPDLSTRAVTGGRYHEVCRYLQWVSNDGALKQIYPLLLQDLSLGASTQEEGCRRLYFFLAAVYGTAEERQQALDQLWAMSGSDRVALGYAAFQQARVTGQIDRWLADDLIKSIWPPANYLGGRYSWQKGKERRTRAIGVHAVCESAAQGVREAARAIANYGLIYENGAVRGMRNYLSDGLIEYLRDHESYQGYRVRRTVSQQRNPGPAVRWDLFQFL